MFETAYPRYPAARASAGRIHEHFVRHQERARLEGIGSLAPIPEAKAIERLVDVAFWASLRREEGRPPKISLAYMPADQSPDPLLFERQLPLLPAGLAKLAPAVERPGIHLGVWQDAAGEFSVWGTTRSLPPLCFVVEVVMSGLLVVKHRGETLGKFANVAVLEGDQVKFVPETLERAAAGRGLVPSRLGLDLPARLAESATVLIQLSVSMRAHGRGGALLIVPASSRSWPESVVQPVLYAVSPPHSALADLVQLERSGEGEDRQADIRRAIDALAGLTAVDGATIITEDFSLLAFGTKIARRHGSPQVERVLMTETVEGTARVQAPSHQLGGTRHLSAAQFVYDQRDATALVASQDGRFTIFRWSSADEMVRAHRIEALLL
jgi:DNA integrity scanning protein DisA with diadenylate cyclase activity